MQHVRRLRTNNAVATRSATLLDCQGLDFSKRNRCATLPAQWQVERMQSQPTLSAKGVAESHHPSRLPQI